MSPWSTSRATPSPGSSPCPSRRPSTAPSITGSGGGSRRCSPTSRPGASGWRTASSATRSGSRARAWSWRWRCTGRGPPACGRPRVSPCRPKKSPGATGAEGGPRPDLALQAWPAPHPTPPAVPRPAPAPLERLAELMDGKEVLWFPPDKGAPKWHQPAGDRLFLGIDHTAIAVADTDQSLAFYRDRLGLKVAGESDNYGPEQERLNNVFGAHLRITALRAPSGPGIELLEYLTPRDGRPMPPDTRAGDLWFWHVNLATGSADQAKAALKAGHDALVSPGVVSLPEAELGFSRGLTVRDPDGHALMLEQRAAAPGPA